MPAIRPGGLAPDGDGRWMLTAPDGTVLATYDWSELRLSVSWKVYCFADAAARDAWRDHSDDLVLDDILERLRADGSERRGEPVARDAVFGLALIDEYVRFPEVV